MTERRNEKPLREVSLEGAQKIGQGAHAEVFRIAEDTVVKVYFPTVSMEAIEREKALSRWAFVKGVPTAISYDIVRADGRYGVVYELLNAKSASDYVNASEENLEDFVEKSVVMMRQIHGIRVQPGELPDMREKAKGWIGRCGQYLPDEICGRLLDMLETVPESRTLLHGDYHLKNIMVSEGELMLIDMDTLSAGDPVFELSTIFNSYRQFPSIAPEAAAFLGIDVPTAFRIWDRTLELSLKDADEKTRSDTVQKAMLLGCARIIDYMDRTPGLPDRELVISRCVRDILSGFSPEKR